MDTESLIFLLVVFVAFAALLLTFFFKGLLEEKRAYKRGEEPRPGLRFATDYSGVFGILCGIVALVITACIAGRQEGLWRFLPLVFVNVVIQPICILLLAGSAFRIFNAVRGRNTHAFRVIPPESIPADGYRSMMIHRAGYSIVSILIVCSLSYLCFRPFL